MHIGAYGKSLASSSYCLQGKAVADSHIAVAVHGLMDNRVGGISARKREMLYNCGRAVTTCQRRNVRKC